MNAHDRMIFDTCDFEVGDEADEARLVSERHLQLALHNHRVRTANLPKARSSACVDCGDDIVERQLLEESAVRCVECQEAEDLRASRYANHAPAVGF